MLLQFRMLSDEDDNFLRDYLLPPSMTLADLHAFISDDLKYEKENMASFFLSDKEWNRLAEYTYMDMGIEDNDPNTPKPMTNLTLAEAILGNYNRLIYQFDVMGDRALYLELIDAQRDKDGDPQVMLANGEAPDQFDPEASPTNRSIFDEIMSEVSNEAFYATAESTGGQQSAVIYEAKSANTWRSRTLSEYCGV